MADSTSLTSRQVNDTYPRTQRAVLTSIALGVMLVPLNSTMIAIALPDVIRAFNVDVHTAGWLVIAYLITMDGLQLVMGQLGDRFGRRRLVLGALIWHWRGSVLDFVAGCYLIAMRSNINSPINHSLGLSRRSPSAVFGLPGAKL